MKKTNAVRLVEKLGINVDVSEYPVDESDLSAVSVAGRLGIAGESIFKTLVVRSDKGEILLACILGDRELDLKALARASGNKKVEMVHMKEIQTLTGYIRGGVSPLGTKKNYPLFIDNSIMDQPSIYVSAGKRGLQMVIAPENLLKASMGRFCSIVSEK